MGLKQTTTIKQTAQLLADSGSVALFAHTNPDGDTIGACIALKLILQQMGKNVAIYCDSDLSSRLLSFHETATISKTFEGKYDLLVAVDCGDIYRIGEFGQIYAKAHKTLTIDHHGGEYYSHFNCVYTYPSTCQIIYEMLAYLDVCVDSVIATYLYMGLCTDTGNFAYNVDINCFDMASNLLRQGADIEKIYQIFFRDTSFEETKLLARALSRIRSYYDSQLFLTYITRSDLDELGLEHSTTSGIVGYTIDISTAKVGVCICEVANNSYKVSMRGKGVSVNDVCKEFGGGGHKYASGCRINGFLEDVIEKIVRAVGFKI